MLKHNDLAIPEEHNYDLAIIGAGPAGALAAALASNAGFSTILVERKKQQPKICGGFISRRSLSLLPKEINLYHPSFQEVDRLNVCLRDRTYTYHSDRTLGLLVKRADFDNLLIDYACSRGISFSEGMKLSGIKKAQASGENKYLVTLSGENGLEQTLQTCYLLGADGALGISGRLSGMRKKTELTGWGVAKISPIETGDPEPAALSFYPLPFLGGMGWSFSGRSWTNRGVGGLARPKKLTKTYYTLFPEENSNKSLPAWPLPFLGPVRKAAIENILLIGDAAGLVEPFSGEGIFNAFLSATLAVKALIQAEKHSCNAAPFYRDSFNDHFRNKLPAILTGATLLHAGSLLTPSKLPQKIAALMENRLWFNCNINTDLSSADRAFL